MEVLVCMKFLWVAYQLTGARVMEFSAESIPSPGVHGALLNDRRAFLLFQVGKGRRLFVQQRQVTVEVYVCWRRL